MVSDLLVAIRDIDEVDVFAEEIVVCGARKDSGALWCHVILHRNLIVNEKTLVHLGSNAF